MIQQGGRLENVPKRTKYGFTFQRKFPRDKLRSASWRILRYLTMSITLCRLSTSKCLLSRASEGGGPILDERVFQFRACGCPMTSCTLTSGFVSDLFSGLRAVREAGSALCSPVPVFPGTYDPGTYVPRYLCSPVPMFPVPMFPDLLQMCCRAYIIRRPSDRHWNCRAAKRNISQNVKT